MQVTRYEYTDEATPTPHNSSSVQRVAGYSTEFSSYIISNSCHKARSQEHALLGDVIFEPLEHVDFVYSLIAGLATSNSDVQEAGNFYF